MKELATHSKVIETARIDWQYSTPVSEGFNDIYYSRDSGEDETRHVFLQHNKLEQRWRQNNPGSFTIGETGFGTGLNFFCAADLWHQLKRQGALGTDSHLHFVSVERYPLDALDMEHVCCLWPKYQWLADPLMEQYPAPVQGMHRLYFPTANITLTLIFDDAIAGYQALDGTVDAWFLDGFSPAQNPDMWQPELFEQLGRLSQPGTTVATFTAAGLVRRGLQAAGFQIEKVPGYGRKRDMLRGEIQPSSEPECQLPPQAKPWFHYNYQACQQTPGTVAIIGAGLAGANVANSLARRGWRVTVLEQEAQIASQGSGNPTGITFTKLSLHDTPQNRFYQGAYLYACRYLARTLRDADSPEGQDWNLNGLLRLAHGPKEANEQAALLANHYWPAQLMEGLNAEKISRLLGFDTELSGLMLHGGGWLNPAALCHILLNQSHIELSTGQKISQLVRRNQKWEIQFASDRHPDAMRQFDAVVLANSFGVNTFTQAAELPLKPVRGQISYVPATPLSSDLQYAINYDGYINPARNGFHCVGATFNPRVDSPKIRPEDHQWNATQLSNTLPSLARELKLETNQPVDGRVGFRCQTPDYLPIIGPLPDTSQYRTRFADLGKGFLKRDFPLGPNYPNLFVTCGHGSRGITSTCLAGEIIAAYLCGEPQPVDREVLFTIHPARFLIRNIIRGRQ